MIKGDIAKGTEVRYMGNVYTFTGLGKLKDPTTGVWVQCALYSNNNENFARESLDFRAKFSVKNNQPEGK
jgi:hypothetical protein